MLTDVLTLDPAAVAAEGGERMVFVHPDDAHRLIKVVKPRRAEDFPGWSFGHLTQRFIPAARWRTTVKQYEEYNRLMLNRLFDVDFSLPISHLYGFVKTNLGLGCVTERVTDADGNNAPTLKDLAHSGKLTQKQLDELNAFIGTLYGVSVCVNDAGLANMVYGHRHTGPADIQSEPSWVLVDGFGDRYAITIRTISRTVRSLGIDDNFKRKFPPGTSRLGLTWDPKGRKFDYDPSHKKLS